jgi:D-glycero-alpha-D-manno-heptose-7-phosphate kinase
MIVTRTPFRISFAGGGSDLPAYYREEPGMVLSAAINRYVYLTVKKGFADNYRVSYSRTELPGAIDDIEHPIVRECLKAVPAPVGLEIVSIADLPAQTGMGSSSSFTVGLLGALHALNGRLVSAEQLASLACEIEIERLGEPIGKQDQYIAAYGGLQFIQFMPNGRVFVDPVICAQHTRSELNRRLLLFYTGATREAKSVLQKQNSRTAANRSNLRDLCRIAGFMREVIVSGKDLNAFGRLLHDAWMLKKSLETSISTPLIDEAYQAATAAGALGGKVLGAGGGGFLLFFCEPHLQNRLRAALAHLKEVPFAFEPQGCKVIYVGDEHWSDAHLATAIV